MDKPAHSGLKIKAGDVVEMLRKTEVGLEALNQTVALGLGEWSPGLVPGSHSHLLLHDV